VAPLFATCGHRPWASFAIALSGDCIAPRNYGSAGIKCREMIRVVLTDAVYDAVASTLPNGATAADVTRAGPMVHPSRGGGGRPREGAMRRPGESYSEVILKLVELKTSDQK
jgi:hypothetical protein